MTSPEGLFSRLKKRKLVQWALAYLAGAWLLLQVLDFLRENFAWSTDVVRITTVVLAFGFLGALVLAWFHGEQGHQRVGRTELVLLVCLFLAGGVAVSFMPTGSSDAGLPEVRRADPSATVVVLPFDNLSVSEEDALLAEGLTLEIGSQLSKVADLRVISRSAVLASIASGVARSRVGVELGAGSMLEGSVQAAGGRIRITGSLVDVASQEQVWSESYDRELQDLFELQSEVAITITEALEAELTDSEQARIEAHGTEDLAAFALFQRQFSLLGSRPEENRLGIEILKEAIDLDPDFADAVARLGWRYVWEVRLGRREAGDSARMLAERAVDLNPELGYAHYALASVLVGEGRTAAIREYRRAHALEPSNASALNDLAYLQAVTGQLEEAVEFSYRAVELEPNDENTRWHAAWPLLWVGDDARTGAWIDLSMRTLDPPQPRNELTRLWLPVLSGDLAEARRLAMDALSRLPGGPEVELSVAEVLLAVGDLENAARVLEPHATSAPDHHPVIGFSGRTPRSNYAFVLWELGETERARELFDQAVAENERLMEAGSDIPFLPLELAAIHSVRGEVDAALDRLEEAVRGGHLAPRYMRLDPMLEPLRGNDRFEALLGDMDDALARIRTNIEREGVAAGVDAMIAAGR